MLVVTIIAAALIGWFALSLPLAVAIGRAFDAGESAEEPSAVDAPEETPA